MKTKIISAVLLALFLAGFPVATALSPKSSFSEMENRVLAEWPNFSLKSVADRTFMSGVEAWFSDHFVGRDLWVSAKGYLEYYSGKRENNNVYILDNRLIEDIAVPDERKTRNNIDAIRAFVDHNKKPTYLMLVPTAAGIYPDALPEGITVWDQRRYLKDINRELVSITNEIDVSRVLYENRSKYIFYRTDHHWTSTGAFYAFTEASERMGIHAALYKNYNIENVAHDFYGTLYSKVGYRGISPDIISLYSRRSSEVTVTLDVFDGKETKTYSSLYFKDYLSKKDKYGVFLGQNQPMVTVRTDSKTGKSLLIFKDSFAHSFVPFLTSYYDTITLVDLRYVNNSYTSLVSVADYDQVLLLYSADTFAHTTDIAKLGLS